MILTAAVLPVRVTSAGWEKEQPESDSRNIAEDGRVLNTSEAQKSAGTRERSGSRMSFLYRPHTASSRGAGEALSSGRRLREVRLPCRKGRTDAQHVPGHW